METLLTTNTIKLDDYDRRVAFSTDSKSYLDQLIPKEYQDFEPSNPRFTVKIGDRSYTAFGRKRDPQTITIDVDVLKEISQLWLLIIPTLSGFPELVIEVDLAPVTLLPALKQITQNIGHIGHYSLYSLSHDSLDESDDDGSDDEQRDNKSDDNEPDGSKPDDDEVPLESYLKPPTSILRVLEYLERAKTDVDGGLWSPQERNKAITLFLTTVERWTNAAHNQYDGGKFNKKEMKENLPLLIRDLEWFKARERKRKRDEKEKAKDNAERGKRVRRTTL